MGPRCAGAHARCGKDRRGIAVNHWVVQLDAEASRRRDQKSFHVFAEGQHSGVRGQIFQLEGGEMMALPHDKWPRHLFIVVGLRGVLDAYVAGEAHVVETLTQLVVTPGTPCKLTARAVAAIELISLLSVPPR